jgi:bacillithiol biosynthesis deacetylase BshB1
MVATCDLLAVGAHPDDVELGCAGTLARAVSIGHRVGIVDATAGERGTRGGVIVRAREAAAAAQVIGVAWRSCLGLPDGSLDRHSEAQIAALVEVIRRAAPRVVLVPHRDDPHPDHAEAANLVGRASFLAGVRAYHPKAGEPVRPRLLLAYPGPRQIIEPAVVVDVSAFYEAKRNALAAHGSQFEPGGGPVTHLVSGHFLAAIEGRDRACGNLVGCEFGEGFSLVGAAGADDLAWLIAGGQ